MKLSKKFKLFVALLLFPAIVFASAQVLDPSKGTITSTPVAGKNPSGEAQSLSIDGSGNLKVSGSLTGGSLTPTNGIVTITTATSTSRTQMTTLTATACTLQAKASNTGNIYLGGSTVTNSSGSNEGLLLEPGDTYSTVSLSNLNQVYVATDTANDKVKYFCN